MSHSIEVPGGTAEFYDADELTPRRKRPVEQLGLQVDGLIKRIQSEEEVPDISDRQAEQLARFSEVCTFMWLKSWTVDLPFPTESDALLDLPGPLFDALQHEAGRLQADPEPSKFEPSDATLEDPNSPTGVLGG